MNNIVKRFAGLILLSLFMLLYYKLTAPFYHNAISSSEWSIAEGKVLKSRVNPNAGDNNNLYQLQFAYEYIVDGKTHHGKGRYFNLGEASQSWKGDLYQFAEEHPVGSTIEVYYNPNSPEDCTITTGMSLLGWLLIGMNFLFLFMSVHLVLFPEDWRGRG